jgi:proliferating cell nuclear antigen
MVFEAELKQAVMLKKVVDAMKDLCKDVNFDCSEKGIQVQSMDSSHVALVSLLLRESAFEAFKCDRPLSLGMNVDSLSKILKMCGPNDSLKLNSQNDADAVHFTCEGGDDDRISDFELKLMQIESEHMEIPEQQYKVVAKMPSGEFQKICRDLKEFGETMQVKASKEGITFSVTGDIGAGNVMLKPREADKPEDKVTLTVHEEVTATFALRYLVTFAKAAPLSSSVELGLGPDSPLSVKYALETSETAENGYMQFYLAPKIDE